MINVICMKWGTKYGPEYVNRLYRMVQRHLSLPHRFVCLTDDGHGVEAGVEIRDIPTMPIQLDGPERGWKKLLTFSQTLHDMTGVALFLDLDVIVTGSLDDFFIPEGQVYVIREWNQKHGLGNTSVYRFTIGAHADVLDNFCQNYAKIRTQFRHEQSYLCDYLERQGALHYWNPSWVKSFKRHCMHPFPKSLFVAPELPQQTRVLIFHGYPLPEQAIVGETGKWYRFAKPAPWVADYWR